MYKVLQATIDFKNELNLQLQLIHYFSDAYIAKYKNCKHFLNLCHHKKDFLIESIWNFFATSHGKSACDGIGGTVTRITARASLQRSVKDQILTTKEMVAFCSSEIQGNPVKPCSCYSYMPYQNCYKPVENFIKRF